MDLKDLYIKVECPYNKSHMILPLRMPYHLHRCRKNYPDMKMAVCPYNATHEVKAPELKYHMTHCPNRTLLERDMPFGSLQNALFGKDDTATKGNTDLPRPVAVLPGDHDDNLENWDEDDSPLDFRPQETARSTRRNPNRRRIDSHLRIPQKQSIAASLTMTMMNSGSHSPSPPPGDGGVLGQRVVSNRGDGNNNNLKNDDSSNMTEDRLQEGLFQGKTSLSSSPTSLSSSLSTSSSSSKDALNGCPCPPNALLSNSRLMQQTTSSPTSVPPNHRPPTAINSMGHVLAIGRGRARPGLLSSYDQPPKFAERPGLSATPPFIRMGRGGVRPTFRS